MAAYGKPFSSLWPVHTVNENEEHVQETQNTQQSEQLKTIDKETERVKFVKTNTDDSQTPEQALNKGNIGEPHSNDQR